jgi:hypothetical protein
MTTDSVIYSFSTLGRFLKQFTTVSFTEDPGLSEINKLFREPFNKAVKEAGTYNPWFTGEFIMYSLSALSDVLGEESMNTFLRSYPEIKDFRGPSLKVGIIMAGNIPLVGFHDLLNVCLSGHTALVKMSSKDEKLLPVILDVLLYCDPGFRETIILLEDRLKNPDAVIATGSDNSSRYFEYYFGKYPHLIRKNRNSAAVLTGSETQDDHRKLADDIFLYFGMGCRNVSKLFIPADFNIPSLLDNFESYSYLYNHNKYANNYDYHRAVLLVNREKHLDTGYVLLKENAGYASPVGVLYYEFYESLKELEPKLKEDAGKIQCIVCKPGLIQGSVDFGKSQQPGLGDFADNADTMRFLINLYKK